MRTVNVTVDVHPDEVLEDLPLDEIEEYVVERRSREGACALAIDDFEKRVLDAALANDMTEVMSLIEDRARTRLGRFVNLNGRAAA